MMVLKWTAYILGGLILALALLFLLARSFDGPLGMIPGGTFSTGTVQPSPSDWSFVHAIEEIELQSDNRSRTVWIVALDGRAYVPVSPDFPPFKIWHEKALTDPQAEVRIEGNRYKVRLKRITDNDRIYGRVLGRVLEKYTPPPGSDTPPWVFELAR